MSNSPETFLIDSNILITPYEQYYPFDLVSSFWDQTSQHINDGSIVILDVVKREVERGGDDLSEWINKTQIKNFIDHREDLVIQIYSEVLNYIQSHDCYKESALTEWSKNSVADAWIIAAGKAHKHTVITFETYNNGLSSVNPSKKAKIPDVCAAFGVPSNNLYYMMRKLSYKM